MSDKHSETFFRNVNAGMACAGCFVLFVLFLFGSGVFLMLAGCSLPLCAGALAPKK